MRYSRSQESGVRSQELGVRRKKEQRRKKKELSRGARKGNILLQLTTDN
jgi:hypothetical protein